MRILKLSTSVDVPIGPFLDPGDAVTPEDGLTITQPDIRLKKNGGAWAQKAAAQTLSHEENGYYEVTLDATDTNTLGLLRLAVNKSGALPIWEDFHVVPAAIYDWLIGGSAIPDVNVTKVNGTTQTAGDLAALTVAVDDFLDTEIVDIQNRLPAALVSGRMSSDVVALSGSTAAADRLEAHGLAVLEALTTSGGTTTTIPLNTSTGINGGVPSSVTDFYKNAVFVFTSGALLGQRCQVTGYNGTTKVLTVTALTAAPASGVTGVIV